MGYLITETTDTGQLIKDYIWQEGMHPVAQIDNAQGSEQIIYLYTDHLMTNRLATDQNQAVVWRWEGEAFGETAAQELGGVSVNLRFPGQYFDGESGWFYNYYRYYDPKTGKYITSDPIGLQGGLNTYGYVSQNPLRFTDPFGLRGGCGPGRKPIPNPNDSTGNSELCVPDPTEDPNKKICATAECAAEILPNPPQDPCFNACLLAALKKAKCDKLIHPAAVKACQLALRVYAVRKCTKKCRKTTSSAGEVKQCDVDKN